MVCFNRRRSFGRMMSCRKKNGLLLLVKVSFKNSYNASVVT